MSFFDFFRKADPEDVLRDLCQCLVIATLKYGTTINDSNNNMKSSNAAAELLFLLLHLVDISMFALLSPQKRELYFSHLTLEGIRDYSAACIKQEAPADIESSPFNDLLERFNSRQLTYAKCKSLMGDALPWPGSKLFAFSFFVMRELDGKSRAEFDEILAGDTKMSESNREDFPSLETVLENTAFVVSYVKAIDIDRRIRKLR